MTIWQRRLRFGLGVFVVLFAVGVYLAIRKPARPAASRPASPIDAGAISTVVKGRSFQIKRGQVTWDISYDSMAEFADGTSRMHGVKMLVTKRGGRDFEITGEEGTTNRDRSAWLLKGHVQIKSSDGGVIQADEVSSQGDDIVRAPGPVTITRPSMHGTAVGLLYDQPRDVITLLEQVDLTGDADAGKPATHITAGGAVWSRAEGTQRYERGATIVRGTETLQAETITASLTPEPEETLKTLELVDKASIAGAEGGSGTLRGLHANTMNLTYWPGGQALQHAILSGQASVEIASGDRGGTTGISGELVDLTFDEDGTTLLTLLARGAGPDARAELRLPADATGPPRSVKAVTIQGPPPGTSPAPAAPPAAAKGSGPARGLTSVRFTDRVEYRETPAPPATPRLARSSQLDLAVQPGFASVDEAHFTGGVRFEQGTTLQATARDAMYRMKHSQLELTGVDDKGQWPQVVDEQATIQGKRLVVQPDTRNVQAFEAVQATFRPAPKRPDGSAVKTPAFFAQNQPASATADGLVYDGAASHAVFTSSGRSKLWQADTCVYGQTIEMDDRTGNLKATGSVVSTMMLDQTDAKTQRKEKTKTTASGGAMDYNDAKRQAVYTQDVQIIGGQGNLHADKATLTLGAEASGVERLDAAGHVDMLDPGTFTTGARRVTGETLAYTSADEQYLVRGKPVKYKDESYETTGDSLTFWKSVDRIKVDGVERTRTQAKSGRK